MADNFIPISRDVFEHWIYQDAEYFKVWMTMLARARYSKDTKTGMYKDSMYTIGYGQFLFGYKSWSEDCGISYQRIRNLIKKLIASNMIKVAQKSNHFSVYEIVNYAKFNSQPDQPQQEVQETSNNQTTVSQQSANSLATTKEESNKDNKEKKKDISAAFDDYTSNIALADALHDFFEMRKTIRAPMTARAVTLLLKELDKLAGDDQTKIDILNQSILKNWRGVFALQSGLKVVNGGNNKPAISNEERNKIRQMYGLEAL